MYGMMKKILRLVVIASLFISSFALYCSMAPVDAGGNGYNEPMAPVVSHSPIRINSTAEFASKALAESWQGDGSAGNPYIIENYDINGSL
jgi:hypothetical protein